MPTSSQKNSRIESFSSDRIRKTLAGLPLKQRTPAEHRKSLYSPEMSIKTYEKLQSVGIERLEDGKNVIMDATFSSREIRSRVVEMLEEKKFNYVFIEAQASDEIIQKRLKERDHKQGLISDARLEDFELLDKYYQPPQEIPPESLVEVNTGQPVDETLPKPLYSTGKSSFERGRIAIYIIYWTWHKNWKNVIVKGMMR
ncbi:MAG: AAA family ATPase [Balneolaceae bacterium]|nr:AAA family ATPase [Balneolaceae bacterium]